MFNSNMVACVKVGGKILREDGNTVFIPWGTEYSILIKNIGGAKAKVKVFVDGADATDGVELVVDHDPKNNSVELSRFITNGNLLAGNSFKFIERTKEIEDFRGIGPEDGLVRIEWEFAKQIQQIAPLFYPPNVRDVYGPSPSWSILRSAGDQVGTRGAESVSVGPLAYSATVGITVPGSISNQEFQQASGFITDGIRHSMIFQLVGETVDGSLVSKPVTVDVKPKCQTCGRMNKATSKFCSSCGTSLQII